MAPAAAPAATINDPDTVRVWISSRESVSASAALVRYAKTFVGVPYRWGGSDPSGFDCSGYIQYVYARFGVKMDHSTYSQRAAYPAVARKNLRAGDLVFFSGTGHAGIYIGRGRFIHSPRSGKRIHVASLSDGWYARSYSGAVRPPLSGQRLRSTSVSDIGRSVGTRDVSSAASRA